MILCILEQSPIGNMERTQFFLVTFLLVVDFGNELASTMAYKVEPHGGASADLISLYDQNDPVIELTNQNISANIYDAENVWFVEFYSHWCGHCKRFSPTWKKLAREFDVLDWRDKLHFGAVNCAQQDCNSFNIRQTPTLRLFYGGMPGEKGIDVPIFQHNADIVRRDLLHEVEKAQSYGFLKSEKLPNFLLVRELETSVPEDKKAVAYVVEENNQGILGREVIFSASKNHPQLQIRRMDWFFAQNTILHHMGQGLSLPLVLFAPVRQKQPDWSQMKIGTPRVSGSWQAYATEMNQFLDSNMRQFPSDSTSPIISISSTTTTTTTTTQSPIIIITPSQGQSTNQDNIAANMGDLEKALYYTITKEIPAKQVLNQPMLNTVFQLLENALRYLPLRAPLRHFLITLRDWPLKMELTSIRGQDYLRKVNELMAIYQPFKATPEDYVGCRGSKPIYRGYPCSLWQLFHAMMVNAAIKGDPSMALGGRSTVARNMVNYIHYFFSCTDCAYNFRMKVQSLGFLPNTKRDSVLWLWQIHNMANKKLKGDATEDPKYPKVMWPTPKDCPGCRAPSNYYHPDFAIVDNQVWNMTALMNHHIEVYGATNLVQSTQEEWNEEATIGETDRLLQALKEVESSSNKAKEVSRGLVDGFCSNHYDQSILSPFTNQEY